MAKELKLRRGTTVEHETFTGAEGEVTADLDKNTLVLHDGNTAGGFSLTREDFSNKSGLLHHKEIKLELERLSGSNFPQGIYVDEIENKIYVGHSRGSDAETKFAVYDWTTGTLLGSFTAGASDFPEGFAVVHEGADTFLYSRSTTGSEGPLGKYDITSAVLDGSSVGTAVATYDVKMHYQMSFDGYYFYIELRQVTGTFNDRIGIAKYDTDFNFVGVISVPAGYFGSNRYPNLPKKQSFAIRHGILALGMGGGSTNEIRRLQGCRVFNLSGDILAESLHNHERFVDNINDVATVGGATTAENEGVYIDSIGDIYTLFVANSTSNTLKVIREFCFPSVKTKDFTSSAQSHPGYIGRETVYPSTNDSNLRKLLTGEIITSVKDIFAEMKETGLRRYEFYTSSVSTIALTDTINLPTVSRATIYNLNNTTGFLHIERSDRYYRYLLQYNDSTDNFTVTLQDVQARTVNDADSVDNIPNGIYRTTSSTSNTPGTFGTLVIERYDANNIYQQFTPNMNASQTHREFYRKRNGSTGVWTEWYQRWATNNTTVDANGFIKQASPIVKVYADYIEANSEANEAKLVKSGIGVYAIYGTLGFADKGWYIETPKNANGEIKVFVEYSQDEEGTIYLNTYKPEYVDGEVVAGEPADIPEGRWIDLRLKEPEVDFFDYAETNTEIDDADV
jgi:hypothetical protein